MSAIVRSVWVQTKVFPLVYSESLKREVKTNPMYEFRCDERLKLKLRNLHTSDTLSWSRNWTTLKIETRLRDEMLASEMGEYVFLLFLMNR